MLRLDFPCRRRPGSPANQPSVTPRVCRLSVRDNRAVLVEAGYSDDEVDDLTSCRCAARRFGHRDRREDDRMRLDAIVATDLAATGHACAHAEAIGCDGIMVPEVAHDPFLPLTLAAVSTTRIRLATGIAVAFARNPMNVAVWLPTCSVCRTVDSCSDSVRRSSLTSRAAYSMPWSSPAARMREFVAAVRAIWTAWSDDTPLDFRGEYYQHTLMTPMFSHGPTECGWPSIHLAAVGPVMTALAGEIAGRAEHPRLHHPGLRTRGHASPARSGSGPEWTISRRPRGLGPRHGRDGRRRRRPTPRSDAHDHRLLWVHARIPPGPRASRVGRAR